MPGVPDILSDLRDRGIVLGIVSNAQFYTPIVIEALTGLSVEEMGFEPDLCSWSYAHGVAKPSTTLFQSVVSRLRGGGIEPGETLYVGNDMLKDIWTADQCGLKTALFAGDAGSLRLREDEPRCASLQPEWIIKSLDSLKS
jgi:putative hydrolase of the HAD superfamily